MKFIYIWLNGLKNEFKHAHVIGVAQASIDAFEKELQNKIPFSSPSIYGLFITNLFASLNKATLRRQFPGVGMVLNPSHGVVKMFNFKGHRVFYSDIFQEALEFVNSPDYNSELGIYESNEELVQKYIDFSNPVQEVDVTEIQLLDSYQELFDIENHPELTDILVGENLTLEDLHEQLLDYKHGVGDYIDLSLEENKEKIKDIRRCL